MLKGGSRIVNRPETKEEGMAASLAILTDCIPEAFKDEYSNMCAVFDQFGWGLGNILAA